MEIRSRERASIVASIRAELVEGRRALTPRDGYRIVNLTPHAIRIRVVDSQSPTPEPSDRVYPSEGQARVLGESEPIRGADGFPIRLDVGAMVIRTAYGDVTGLPEPAPGVLYAVSLLVMQAHPERRDLIGPATGPPSWSR